MTKEDIINILKTVYDPEVPILDIYNLGLIYDVNVDKDKVNILMTLTSPTCPLSGVIINSIENAIKQKFENANVNIELTFDPVWTPEKIKNEEIKQIFLG